MGLIKGTASLIADFLGKSVEMENQAAMRTGQQASRAISEKHAELWNKDVAKRKAREQQWQLNIAMIMGNQWVGWNGSSVQTLNAPSWRIQNVDNKLFVRVRSKMARLLQDMTPTAIPDSTDFIDIRRASYKERLLHHAHREIGIKRIRFRAAQWLVSCGEVYAEVYWDESAGETFAADGGAFSEGDVAVKIYDPFAVWPGAGCSAGNNGGRLWTVDIIPVELARLKYDDPEIAPDASEGSDTKIRSSMDNFFSGGGAREYTSGKTSGLEDGVMVKTLREYRTAALPEGRKSIIINGKVYDEKPLLWDGIQHIINFPSYSSYHGDAVEVRNSIQQQKSYNRLRSNWEEYVRTMAKGKILAHRSLNIKSSQFDSEHMEIIKYDGSGPPPTPWMPPPMPNDTANLMQLCVTAMDDVWSDHAASQGKAPASASGSLVNYLTEADAAQHTAMRDEWLAGWERADEKILDVIAGRAGEGTGYKNGRSVTVVGENRRADILSFKEDMIAGRNRVYIVTGGALPENKTLRAEVARRWFEAGVLGDPTLKETQRKFLKMVDAGVDADTNNVEFLDEIRAEWENDQLEQGVPVQPRPEDDEEIHVFTILSRMKSDQFLNYPPEIQQLYYDHFNLHLAKVPVPVDPAMLTGAAPPQTQPGNSPAVGNPVDMLKSVIQGGEPPPAVGAPGPEMPQQ